MSKATAWLIPLICAFSTAAQADHTAISGELHDASGVAHGKVSFRGHGDGLSAVVKVRGLSPGQHGMHIHSVGKCSGDGFADAAGHWNPDGKQHGLANPMGSHRGDLPDIAVDARGNGQARFKLTADAAGLLDGDGAALVIHAKPDDGMTDPSGNSGGRLLCAVLSSGGRHH